MNVKKLLTAVLALVIASATVANAGSVVKTPPTTQGTPPNYGID